MAGVGLRVVTEAVPFHCPPQIMRDTRRQLLTTFEDEGGG